MTVDVDVSMFGTRADNRLAEFSGKPTCMLMRDACGPVVGDCSAAPEACSRQKAVVQALLARDSERSADDSELPEDP